MLAMSDAMWVFLGVVVTQFVVVFGIVYAAKNARAARTIAESTNEAVNNVDKEKGEPKLIDQVRSHGRQLKAHNEYHRWTAAALVTIADEIGVKVPPLPEEVEEESAA